MPKHVDKELADQTYPFQILDSPYSNDAHYNMFKTIVMHTFSTIKLGYLSWILFKLASNHTLR